MFNVAYIRKIKEGKVKCTKYQNHSLQCIIVGKCSKSDAFLFYDPKTKQEITSIDFTYDSTLPTGPIFGLQYEQSITINCLSDGYKHIAPLYPPELLVRINKSDTIATVVHVPTQCEPVYTLLLHDGSLEQYEEHTLTTAKKEHQKPMLFPVPQWVKHHGAITVMLPHMENPRQGFLLKEKDTWSFLPGRTVRSIHTPVLLPNFEEHFYAMHQKGRYNKGHISFCKLFETHPLLAVYN
eukprot:15365865-Ditylum_brightwellii.AAC.2